MKLHILFSNSHLIGSKLISWVSSFNVSEMEQVPSHSAVLLDGEWVIEAVTGSGVRVIPYRKWKEKNNEIAKIPLDKIKKVTKREDFDDLLNEMWGKGYDFEGLFFFGFALLKHYFLGEPLPKKNTWEQEHCYFCTEFVGRVSGHNYSMTTPAMLYERILKNLE